MAECYFKLCYVYAHVAVDSFLNQACMGYRPVRAWFLRIASVHECLYARVFVCVCTCMCPHPRLLITSGMVWCDIDLI